MAPFVEEPSRGRREKTMPDVAVQCPECGAERVVSEYATLGSFECLVCSASLEFPEATNSSGLSVRRNLGPASVPVNLTTPDETQVLASEEESERALKNAAPSVDVHEGRVIEASSRAWLGYLGFSLVAALLIGFQWKQNDFSQYQDYYIWGRNVVALGSYFIVILVAFQDTTMAGLLCLFFFPYSLIYASNSLESYLLRGVFLASLMALMAEVYFFGSQSALSQMGDQFTNFVDSVDGLIKSASE